jgi:thiosulfate/3-mercaptopyruvate sulfurtransferase
MFSESAQQPTISAQLDQSAICAAELLGSFGMAASRSATAAALRAANTLTGRSAAFCSIGQLNNLLSGDQGIVLLDVSWHLDSLRDARAEFCTRRIPGAQFFDINEVADVKLATTKQLPHMFPSMSVQKAAAKKYLLSPKKPVVVYETGSLFSSPRAWWTLQHMGYSVSILDGGLSAWAAQSLPVDTSSVVTEAIPVTVQSSACSLPSGILSFKEMQAISQKLGRKDGNAKAAESGPNYILDARAPGRFGGSVPEPRPNMPSGHMPGSVNVPFAQLVDTETGKLHDCERLRSIFSECGVKVDPALSYATTCGSGVTAAVILLALHECSVPWGNLKLYDGSWVEWTTNGGDVVQQK